MVASMILAAVLSTGVEIPDDGKLSGPVPAR